MESNAYPTLFSPISLGGLTLKNRIVFGPASLGPGRELYFHKIRQIVQGGAGLIITGGLSVIPRRGRDSLYSSKGFAFYQSLTEMVHKQGAKICAQLYVPRTSLPVPFYRLPALALGRISAPELFLLRRKALTRKISRLSRRRILYLLAQFVRSAQLAQEAGFDMIQIQGDGLCADFANSQTNHRSDHYGGTAVNRSRLACQVVWTVKRAVPHMPVDFRLVLRQENPPLGSSGILVRELPVFIPRLERAGADSFHVSLSGLFDRPESAIPTSDHPLLGQEGCFLSFARELKNLSSRPVCAAGGLTDPDFLEHHLDAGTMDLASMTRQLIADPQWPAKAASGNSASILYCIRCNQECVKGPGHPQGGGCIYDRLPSRWPEDRS